MSTSFAMRKAKKEQTWNTEAYEQMHEPSLDCYYVNTSSIVTNTVVFLTNSLERRYRDEESTLEMLYIHIGPCFANKSRLNKFILTSKTSNSKDFRKCVDKKAKQKGEQNIVDASWLFMRNKRSYTAYVGFKLNSNNSTKPVHSHVHFDPCSSGNFHGIISSASGPNIFR